MKILKNTNVMLILLITVAISIYGFSKPGNEKVRKGSIGDVKYSILKPAEFIKENGKGWILMDGRQITKSSLYKKYGYEKAFDARGVFIRGMNLDRNDDFSDPDGNRHIGSQQDDATRLSNINSITDNADVFTIAYADKNEYLKIL